MHLLGTKFDEIFRRTRGLACFFETFFRSTTVSAIESRDPLPPILRPITELNNNTETFASTYLKVHRFSVYKFPPRGVETVNRIYIREGGFPSRERIRGGSVYGKINGKGKRKKGRRRTGNNRGPDIARDVSRYCSSIVRSSFIIFVSATTTGTRNTDMLPFPASCARVERRWLRGKKRKGKKLVSKGKLISSHFSRSNEKTHPAFLLLPRSSPFIPSPPRSLSFLPLLPP